MIGPGVNPILDYLREHSGRYSLEVLRQQLLQSGYSPSDVDWAVQFFQEENPPPARQRIWPKALLVLAVNAVLLGATIAVGVLQGADTSVMSVLGPGLFLLGCAEFLGGIGLIFPEKTRSLGLALLLGFFLSVGLGVLVLGGVCIYFLSQGNQSWH